MLQPATEQSDKEWAHNSLKFFHEIMLVIFSWLLYVFFIDDSVLEPTKNVVRGNKVVCYETEYN
jgi:hypothetical protein